MEIKIRACQDVKICNRFLLSHTINQSKIFRYLCTQENNLYIYIYIYIYMKEIHNGIWRIINAENATLLFSNKIFHPGCFRNNEQRYTENLSTRATMT